MSDGTTEIGKDTVVGCAAIAAYTGINGRRVHYLASKGQLPGAFRIGKSWALLKSVYEGELRSRANRTVHAG